MNEFEIIISKVLDGLGYGNAQEILEDKDISLHLFKNENKDKTQYYVVSLCNKNYFQIIDFGDLQSMVYNRIKEMVSQEPAIEKNTSWLIGIQSECDFDDLMEKILLIEENPYYFKKVVFPYIIEELESFSNEISNCTNFIEYIQQEVMKVDRFVDFYAGQDNVYSFLSRLLIKIPSIELQIVKEKELSNLSDNIQKAVQENGLQNICIFLKEDLEEKMNMIDDDISALHDLYYGKDEDDEQI